MCLVTQSCPTLCRLMGCSLPDSSFHGISQARILEWVAISNWVGGNLPHPGIELDLLHLLHWQAGSLSLVPPEKTLLRLQHSLNWTIDSTWVSKWVKVTQTCPTLCDPMDYTLRGILQARILDSVAVPLSRVTQLCRGAWSCRVTQLCPTLWPHGLYSPGNSPGQNAGVGRLSLLQ